MKIKEKVFYIAIILFASIFIASLLMILVYRIPVNRMVDHALESREEVLDEGYSPHWGGYTTRSDGYTDAIMVCKAVYFGDEYNLIERAMLNPSLLTIDGKNKMKRAYNALLPDYESKTIIYPRYWHGYLLFLKPLLYFYNVQEVRLINMMIIILLLMITSILVCERFGKKYLLFLLANFIILNPVSAGLSFQYSDIFYITMITICALVLFENKLRERDLFYIIFLIDGICCAFFDFLTYPLVALGIPLIITVIMECGFIDFIVDNICWLIGYAGMWAGKWVVSYVLTGYNTFKDAIYQITYRSGVDVKKETEEINRLSGITRNVELVVDSPLLVLIIVEVIILIVLIIKTQGYRNLDVKKTLLLLAISLYPFVWYFVVANHSYVHAKFTFFNLCIFVSAIITALLLLTSNKKIE